MEKNMDNMGDMGNVNIKYFDLDNDLDDDIKHFKNAYKEAAEKINDFTTLLNFYNKDYNVIYYDNVASIQMKEVEILFYIKENGSIEFKSREQTE